MLILLLVIFILLLPSRKSEPYVDLIDPYADMYPLQHSKFCTHMAKCHEELYSRPQICKQHFYIAMNSLHDMETTSPELTPTVQYIGSDFETKLVTEYQRNGMHTSTRY